MLLPQVFVAKLNVIRPNKLLLFQGVFQAEQNGVIVKWSKDSSKNHYALLSAVFTSCVLHINNVYKKYNSMKLCL